MSAREEMGRWDAVETATHIRDRDVSAREVLDAAIERAEAAMDLGAIVTESFGRARETPSRGGRLEGVPTFIKDLAQVEGVATKWGTRASGEYVSRKSDPFVTRFFETGVVSLGKSATPELGMTAATEPLGQDPCRNPWDRGRSTGGSSGGAGALVASGVVPIAHGGDGGGSIRIPAACCGLVGLKPSRHRLDMESSHLLPVNVAVHGCLSRTVRDTVVFWEAIESRTGTRLPPIGSVRPGPKRKLRIGVYVAPPRGTPVHPEVVAATRAAATLCESLGHDVEEIPCPFDAWVSHAFMRLWGLVSWVQAVGGRALIHPGWDASKLDPWTNGLAGYFTSARWESAKAIRRLRGLERVNEATMKRFDVLICPTLSAPPPELGYLAPDVPFRTAFDRLVEYAPFTSSQNVAGAPAISLPLGTTEDGLPIGVQLAAARGEDRLLLQLAMAIEEAAPWEPIAPRAA